MRHPKALRLDCAPPSVGLVVLYFFPPPTLSLLGLVIDFPLLYAVAVYIWLVLVLSPTDHHCNSYVSHTTLCAPVSFHPL